MYSKTTVGYFITELILLFEKSDIHQDSWANKFKTNICIPIA